MINADLDQFLGTGWFSEATLYLNGYTYWCEGYWNENKENPMHFFVYKYRSEIVNGKFTRRLDNEIIGDYDIVFEIDGKNEDEVKTKFLKAKIFEGKSFWEVEDKIAWYDEI
jgi:hypothetical protein